MDSTDKRPIVTVTGSHKRTIVFGSLSLEGKKQLFKKYDKFNSDTFVDYLKHIQKRFVGKCIVFVDGATPHCWAYGVAWPEAGARVGTMATLLG